MVSSVSGSHSTGPDEGSTDCSCVEKIQIGPRFRVREVNEVAATPTLDLLLVHLRQSNDLVHSCPH